MGRIFSVLFAVPIVVVSSSSNESRIRRITRLLVPVTLAAVVAAAAVVGAPCTGRGLMGILLSPRRYAAIGIKRKGEVRIFLYALLVCSSKCPKSNFLPR